MDKTKLLKYYNKSIELKQEHAKSSKYKNYIVDILALKFKDVSYQLIAEYLNDVKPSLKATPKKITSYLYQWKKQGLITKEIEAQAKELLSIDSPKNSFDEIEKEIGRSLTKEEIDLIKVNPSLTRTEILSLLG